MLKKTITYTDYDGTSRTEDFFFNYSKAEIAEMELSVDGGMAKMLETMASEKDNKRLVEVFKKFILGAYGKKSPDGKRFVKSQELQEEFEQTEAYSDLFMGLITDEKAAAAFVNSVVPQIPAQASA